MRIFPRHHVREVVSLDGAWQILFPEEGTQISATEWNPLRAVPYEAPSVWEALPGRINYRGQALARKEFHLTTASPVRLVFGGVSHTARVFVDGIEFGRHHNAFTPFDVFSPELAAGSHELMLHISNEHGELSALHFANDYYNYGGITRPAELQVLSAGPVVRLAQFTPERRGATWASRFRIEVANPGHETAERELEVQLAGGFWRTALLCPPGSIIVSGELDCGVVETWSPDQPNLYFAEIRLCQGGVTSDDWRERVGFRTVEVRDGRLVLNGEPVFLQGLNRHEDHGVFGNALPLPVLRQDIALLRELGANAVRTSHYPNDQRFLDLCDENGLLVWEENHARGIAIEQMQHPLFAEQCHTCNEEMVRWHHNHPSIVMWGILNECGSECEEGRAMYAKQFAQIRALDPSRPLVFASCRHFSDRCQDLTDICGWNWYFGWYEDTPSAEGLTRALEWIETHGGAGKPIIASEFGAGAIPGYFDPIRRAKWSEDRQADILAENLATYLQHPRLAGAFIWQFCDVRVDEACAMSRPRCINDKGVVDEFRHPKMAFATVRDFFHRSIGGSPIPQTRP